MIATDLLVFSSIELSAHQSAAFNAASGNEWSVKLSRILLLKSIRPSAKAYYTSVCLPPITNRAC